MKFKIANFNGIMPRKSAKLLPDSFSQVANNTNLLAGNILPLCESSSVANVPYPSFEVFQIPSSNIDHWLHPSSVAGLPSSSTDLTYCTWYKRRGSSPDCLFDTAGTRLSVGFSAGNIQIWEAGSAQTSNSIAVDGAWHFVAVTRTASGSTNLYYDNVLVASHQSSATWSWNSTTNSFFFVGNLNDGNPGGELSDMRIYGRVLSTTELNQIFKSDLSNPITSSLLVRFPFQGDYSQVGSLSLTASLQSLDATDFASVTDFPLSFVYTIYDYGSDAYSMVCGTSGTLAALQAVTNGALVINIGGQNFNITGMNFSAATSFADCAAIIQAAIRAAGADSEIQVSYNGASFVFASSFPLTALADYTGVMGNYWGDGSDGAAHITTNTTLASTTDGDMVVKNYSSLIVDAGTTLTVSNRCKGLAIYVNGDCTINGTISMTARGANAAPPSTNIALARMVSGGTQDLGGGSQIPSACGTAFATAEANSPNKTVGTGKLYVIQSAGAPGGIKLQNPVGSNGSYLQSGGGGAGSIGAGYTSGNGAAGTAFSSGSGGGGGNGTDATENGGAGGNGNMGGAGQGQGGGGAGNPGGSGYASGSSGTAGTLLLFVKGNLIFGSSGKLVSNGSDAGGGSAVNEFQLSANGGSSGGGIILALYGATTNASSGNFSVAPGGQGNTFWTPNAGLGGYGSAIIEQIQP